MLTTVKDHFKGNKIKLWKKFSVAELSCTFELDLELNMTEFDNTYEKLYTENHIIIIINGLNVKDALEIHKNRNNLNKDNGAYNLSNIMKNSFIKDKL